MDAYTIDNLFKGNQLEEMKYWMDNESPHNGTWDNSSDGTHHIKMCEELNTFHKVLTDKSRDIFAVHDLLPTFSTISWYEGGVANIPHLDSGPVEHTIMYNYFSQEPIQITVNDETLTIGNEQAVVYSGATFKHSTTSVNGVSIRMHFNFASPDNYYFIIGNHTSNGFEFPSGRMETEVSKDWL